MDTTQNITPVPEEQLSEQNTAELSAESNTFVDFSEEEAQLAAESEEFSIDGDEPEHEEDSQPSTSYANLSSDELLATFRELLESKPVESIRKDIDAIKSAFYKLDKQEAELHRRNFLEAGGNAEEYQAPERAAEKIFKELFNKYKVKRIAYMQDVEGEKEKNYTQKLQLIEQLKELIETKEDLNRTFTEFRELQNKWHSIGPVPQAHTRNLWDTYNHNVELFYDYIKINRELRDLDLRKNLELKTLLCEKVEELANEEQMVNAFRKLQKYHEQWREIGPVPREQKESLWERFKEATSVVNKKHQAFFEQQKEEQQKNYEAKDKLCQQAEEIAALDASSSKKLSNLSKKVIELQNQWKTIGQAARKDNVKLYERFRKACDTFFANKRKIFAEITGSMQENLKQKISLCERAEELANSDDWKKTTDELIKLQKQWKEIGVVPRKMSEETWLRFRKACDAFFERKSENHASQESGYVENLQKKEALISEVQAFTPSDNKQEDFNRLKEFQQRWNEIGYVPIKEKNRIQQEFKVAIDKCYKALHVSDTDRKLSRFKSKIESVQGSGKSGGKQLRSEREKLFNQIRQLEADVTLWENNIGFFAKSKNADAMIADVRKKIEQAKEEIRLFEEKIHLIDQQYEAQS